MKKILVVVGARPNFVKVALLRKAFQTSGGVELKIFHSGQHYDENMVDTFFKQLSIQPDYFITLQPGSLESVMVEMQNGLKEVVKSYSPDLLIAVGDVNSTLAAAITAHQMKISLAHIESGLRSFDKTMLEEYNRTETDRLSDYLFVTERSAVDNLLKEERKTEEIFFVGNTMVDPLVFFENQIRMDPILKKLSLGNKPFILLTAHRPENVDTKEGLFRLLELIKEINVQRIIFPVHPRTKRSMMNLNVWQYFQEVGNLSVCDPLDYFAFQKLLWSCMFVITDSGGVQEESTYRIKPCITLRSNTERPVTVDFGSNTVTGFRINEIKKAIEDINSNKYKSSSIPEFWDGRATWRIAEILLKKLEVSENLVKNES